MLKFKSLAHDKTNVYVNEIASCTYRVSILLKANCKVLDFPGKNLQ